MHIGKILAMCLRMYTTVMNHQKNIQLLKEYIKTLLATDVIFPGIMPRRWGNEFARSELNAIYLGLSYILNKAHPLRDIDMLAAFAQIDASEPIAMHWFLCEHWEDLVPILALYPDSATNYLASLN